MRRHILLLGSFIALVLLLWTAPQAGAAAQSFEVVAQDDGARMERLADGVYAIIHDDATDQWPHGNTGVIVYDDGVFVIDSAYLPSRAEADIKLIRKATRKPVRYLTTTHWHMDHNNGAIAYRAAFPDLVVLYQRDVDRYIAVNSPWYARLTSKKGSSRMDALEAMEQKLADGVDEDGAPLSEEDIANYRKAIPLRRQETREMRDLDIVRADMAFEGHLTLTLGGRVLEIEDRGRANSPHDVTFYLPKEQILFAGDIMVQSPLPYTGASWPAGWVGVLKDIEATPVNAIVLGHGPTQRDHAYAALLRATFETVMARVEDGLSEGESLEEIQETMPLDDLRESFAPWKEGVSDEDWKYVMDTIIERSFRSVRGQGGL